MIFYFWEVLIFVIFNVRYFWIFFNDLEIGFLKIGIVCFYFFSLRIVEACACVCVWACMYVRVYGRVCVWIVCMCVYGCVCVWTCVFVCVWCVRVLEWGRGKSFCTVFESEDLSYFVLFVLGIWNFYCFLRVSLLSL